MRLSIVMCAKDPDERLLRACLDSILRSDISDYEIVLADDGSARDLTFLEGEYAPLRVLRLPHEGTLSARIAGALAAKGEIVAYCDCDDLVSFSHFSRLAEGVEAGFDVAVGGWAFFSGGCPYFLSDDTSLAEAEVRGDLLDWFFARAGREHARYVLWNKAFSAPVLRRAAQALKDRLPDFPVVYAEDALLVFFALREAQSLCAVRGGVYFYRRHGGQVTDAASNATRAACAGYVFSLFEEHARTQAQRERIASWRRYLARSLGGAFGDGGKAEKGDEAYLSHALLPANFEDYDRLLSGLKGEEGAEICGARVPYFEEEAARLGVVLRRKRGATLRIPRPRIPLLARIAHSALLLRAGAKLFPRGGRLRRFFKKFL